MKWVGLTVVFGMIMLLVYLLIPHSTSPTPVLAPSRVTASSAAPQKAHQYTVLLDVSASRQPRMIADGKVYLESLVNKMTFGDRLFISQMNEEGVNDPESRLDITLNRSSDITSLEEQEALDAARKALQSKIEIFVDQAQQKPVQQTDILTTLSIASEQMSSERRNSLVLLSDMLQSDKRFEFEHLQQMPPSDWIANQQQAHLIRPLYGACVLVIGADPSTEEGVKVKEFWEKYFEASNAVLKDSAYRTTPPNDGTACQ